MTDIPTPPGRRTSRSEELEKQIDEHYKLLKVRSDIHYEVMELKLARFVKKAMWAFAFIGITSIVGLAGFGVLLSKQHHTSDEIQQQRFESLVTTCQQQNDRHDRTILKARALLPPANRELVILLVNELQPYVEDCVAVAKSKVKG